MAFGFKTLFDSKEEAEQGPAADPHHTQRPPSSSTLR